MEENIKLVKEFSHTAELLRKGVKAYQKKYVYPKSLVQTIIYLLMAIGMVSVIISGKINDKMELIAYFVFVLLIALIFRQWFNPLKQRDSIVQSIVECGNSFVYRLTVKEKTVEISTVSEIANGSDEETAEDICEAEDYEEESDAYEDTVIPIDSSLKLIEKDDFFLMVAYSGMVYYIIPKADFSPEELEIMRSIAK